MSGFVSVHEALMAGTFMFPQSSPGGMLAAAEAAEAIQNRVLTPDEVSHWEPPADKSHPTVRGMAAVGAGAHIMRTTEVNPNPVNRNLTAPTRLAVGLIATATRNSGIAYSTGREILSLDVGTPEDHERFVAFAHNPEALEGYRQVMSFGSAALMTPGSPSWRSARDFRDTIAELEVEFKGVRPGDERHAEHMGRRAELQIAIAEAVFPHALKAVERELPPAFPLHRAEAALASFILAMPSREFIDKYMAKA